MHIGESSLNPHLQATPLPIRKFARASGQAIRSGQSIQRRCLVIDLEDGRELKLTAWQSVTVPAGMRHRTRAEGRTVNLCFEKLGAETVFVEI